jgi:hypothetical protein
LSAFAFTQTSSTFVSKTSCVYLLTRRSPTCAFIRADSGIQYAETRFFGPTILEFDTKSPVANFEHGGELPYAQCEEGETYVFDVFKNYIVRLSKPGPPMSDIEIQYSTMQNPDERYHSSDSLPAVFAVDQRGLRVDDSRGRANISSSPGSEYDRKVRAKLSVRRLVKPLSNLDNDSWMKSSVALNRKEYVSLTQEHMRKKGVSFVLTKRVWGGNAKK